MERSSQMIHSSSLVTLTFILEVINITTNTSYYSILAYSSRMMHSSSADLYYKMRRFFV